MLLDVIKANVTQEGANSRLVNFDVGLGVTGTLENMNVVFDLSHRRRYNGSQRICSPCRPNSVQSGYEPLALHVYRSGEPGQRISQRQSVVLFLESQLNSWMANTVKVSIFHSA